MTLPSNELMTAVLDRQVNSSEFWDNSTISVFEINASYDMNIYELQHLMKEYILSSGFTYKIEADNNSVCIVIYDEYVNTTEFIGYDSEFEAVVRASEFILKEIA